MKYLSYANDKINDRLKYVEKVDNKKKLITRISEYHEILDLYNKMYQ